MEALDRVKEILADGDHPFPIERKILKELLARITGENVLGMKFLSSGACVSLVQRYRPRIVLNHRLTAHCRHVPQGSYL